MADAGGIDKLGLWSRRTFVTSTALVAGGALQGRAALKMLAETASVAAGMPLREFGYHEVLFEPGVETAQLQQTHTVLMGLSDDALLKPYRVRAGESAPGPDLGGWYDAYAYAPGHSFGQWLSALSRYAASTGDAATRAKVESLVRGYLAIQDTKGRFFEDNRFVAYTLEKLNCGFIDAYKFGGDPMALEAMSAATTAALPYLPEKALSRAEQTARPHKDVTYTYDEAYTLPENYFLAWQRSGDTRYRDLAVRFLHNQSYFTPLAAGENVLPGLHAFSHLNALNSAMQAYLALGDEKYLRAAKNGFGFIQEQSYVTGGWGPDERFVTPGRGELAKSLTTTHSSFETPCGSYGHFKLTRSLLRITREARYGDSMETVLYNTVLGSKPLQPSGESFYYSDYNFEGSKGYTRDKWPCCSGTLPQVVADYRISAFFEDESGVYVNLYLPATLKAHRDGGALTVSVRGNYPIDGTVKIDVASEDRHAFSMHLRIPVWAGSGARILVNGRPFGSEVRAGTFASINRRWGRKDRIELELPMSLRLQQVDAETPGTVALMRGPLVLFPMGGQAVRFRDGDLLAARQLSESEWTVPTNAGDVQFRPFTSIRDEPYGTYVRLA